MNLKTTLFEHQAKAVEKLKKSRVGGLFMEMGTGKTLTAMDLIHRRWDKIDRIIWLCPVSVKYTIQEQWMRHSDLTPHILTDESVAPPEKVLICGIESLQSSDRVYLMLTAAISENTFIVVDESSFIKNPDAVRTKRIIKLGEIAKYKLILSGTPITRYLSDLWSQCLFLSPKVLDYPCYNTFERKHLILDKKIIGRVVGVKAQEVITAKIEPYVFQARKVDCVTLPPKIYTNRYCSMEDDQRKAYDKVKLDYIDKITSLELDANTSNQHAIYERIGLLTYGMFTQLQKVIHGYTNYFGTDQVFENPKLDTLQEILREVDGKKVIIWCRYIHDINTISAALEEKYGAAKVAKFYGELSQDQRQENLTKFRGNADYLLITASCGGYGIDLTCASYNVFYGHSFDYATRAQAEDRTHRIGQLEGVTYINLIMDSSLDTHIVRVLDRKESFIEQFKKQLAKCKTKEEALEIIKKL